MITFTKSLNFFISALLLCSLIVSFNEVTSAVIKRQGTNFCDGFKFTSPNGNIVTKNNSDITVSWAKGESRIDKVIDIELFTDKGLIDILWEEGTTFGPDGTATVNTKIFAPPSLELPAKVMLRSWGTTVEGPSCFVFTPTFTLEK